MRTHEPRPALWKPVTIAAMVLLVVGGLFDLLLNLPVVTGNVPQ